MATCIIGGFAVAAAPTASADDLQPSAGAFSGAARNYGAFAGVGLLNNAVNARANIAEGVVVANSAGLSDYAGTGVGGYAVPGDVAQDGTARVYTRAAPIGAGFTGLNLNPVRSESTSTTTTGTDSNDQNFGALDLRPLGTLDALTGSTRSAWTNDVLTNGGVVAQSATNTGTLQLVPNISAGGVTIPGLSQILPVGQADLGQNTNEVRLVSAPTATCTAALAAETESTWRFADVQLFGGNVGVSWGGESGADDTGTIVARTTGQPGGASLTVSQLPAMTVQIGGQGGRQLQIEPGAAIELSDLFAGSDLGSALGAIIDGQLTYGGTTNVVESADGTHAAGTMNGLNGDLTLAPIPIVAPGGLGSIELGFERVDVDSTMQAGGLNCQNGGSDSNANASSSAAADSNANAAAQAAAQADSTTAASAAANGDASAAAQSAANTDASTNASQDATSDTGAAAAAAAQGAANGDNSSSTNADTSAAGDASGAAAAQSAAIADASTDASSAANGSSSGTTTASSDTNTNSNADASSAGATSTSNSNTNASTAGTSNSNSNSSAGVAGTSSSDTNANGSASGTAATASSNSTAGANGTTAGAGAAAGTSNGGGASTATNATAAGSSAGTVAVGKGGPSTGSGTLAYTGANGALLLWGGITAGIMLLIGIMLAAAAARSRAADKA